MSSNPTTAVPYLSVVATARNDNHGGNLILRMQLFISGLIEQCNRHGVDAELILVEWNPLPDKPRLAEVLNWPADCGRCQIRIIEVPTDVHMRLDHAERLPLFQMIGKNVGIRRARGKFVLATNIDILFSDAVFEYLKSGRMKPGFIYRANRFDVPSEVPHEKSFDEQLEFCRQGVMRRHFHEGSYDVRLRKWVSMRIDVKSNLRGRLFALRWKAIVAWRRVKYIFSNRRRFHWQQFRNRLRWLYDRLRDRVRWFNHQLLLTYRRTINVLRNRSRWLLHRVRDRVRWVLHGCRTTMRRIVYPFQQVYRRCKNTALNRSRWLVHRIRDRVRWTLHNVRNLLRRVTSVVKRIPGWCVQLLLLLLYAPFFVLWVLVFVYRKVDRRIRLRRGLPDPGVIHFDERNGIWLKNRIVNNYALNYAQCAVRGRFQHFRNRVRARIRFMAMHVRDALPQWLEESRFVPERFDDETRDQRKQSARERIDFLRSIDVRPRIGRATLRQIRTKQIRQRQLERNRLIWREAHKKRKAQLKQERIRQIRAERLEKKRRRKFEALRQASLERRQRRAAVKSKRRVQKRVPPQTANGRQASFERPAALQGNASVHRMNGDHPRNELQPENVWQAPDTRLVSGNAPNNFATDLPDQHESNGATPTLATVAALATDVRGNGEHCIEHAEPEILHAASQSEQPQPHTPDPPSTTASAPQTSELKASKRKLRLQWPNMHTNGCGDFTMLAKEDWAAVHGYAEFQMYSMHIDSLFMLCAGHHGFAQQQLPSDAVIYHIEHGIGSGWTPEGNDKLNKRLSDAGIPQISHDQCTAYDESMAANGRAEMFNDENWGFNDIELPETTIHQRPPL